MRIMLAVIVASLLAACGPSGVIAGTVVVENGSAQGVALVVYGPVSAAAVSNSEGAFTFNGLPDGDYVLRASAANTDESEQSLSLTVTGGKQSQEAKFTFRRALSTLSGTVRFSDASSPINLTVTAAGPEVRSARTNAEGQFRLEGLKSGAYLVTVEGHDTKEGRVSVSVFASGMVEVGELLLSPVGRLVGQVTSETKAVAGASVDVPGTSLRAVTNADGRFTLDGVPTGAQVVRATGGTAPYLKSVSLPVMVMRGANPELTLALADEAPKVGSVTGLITFRGSRNPKDITVSVPGTTVSVNPDSSGRFALMVPVGSWDVVASAFQHPKITLARINVIEGSMIQIPGQELSWYRPLWRAAGPISSATRVGGSVEAPHPWSLVLIQESVSRLALINAQTQEFRIIAIGNTQQQLLSTTAKYAVWVMSNTVFVHEVGTARTVSFTKPDPVTEVGVSSDESTLFMARSNGALIRVQLPMTESIFPADGGSPGITHQGPDRWFVREGDAGLSVRLVTPTADYPDVFTNTASFDVTPTAWALTTCVTAGCQLWVLGPTATVAQKDELISPPLAGFVPYNTTVLSSGADYPCFNSGVVSFCVTARNGTHLELPGTVNRFQASLDGGRAIYQYDAGTLFGLREEAMPINSRTPDLGTRSSEPATIGWLSGQTAFALLGSTARTLHLVRDGGVETTTDISPSTVAVTVTPPLLVLGKNSTSTWQTVLGDGPLRPLERPTTQAVTGATVRPITSTPFPQRAFVAFETSAFFDLDEVTGTSKVVSGAYLTGVSGAFRTNASDAVNVIRIGGAQAYYWPPNGAFLEHQEGGASLAARVGSNQVAQAQLSIASDGRTLLIGGFGP